MTYPHESIEDRLSIIEAAVARLTRDFAELQRRGPAAASSSVIASTPEVDKWTAEWLSGWNDKGRPVARIATPLECRKVGGGGKGDWDGDPVVKWDPKFWKKESWSGRHYSQCPPEYLEMVADSEEYRAFSALKDPEKKKYAKYSLRSAALAKGWARMIKEDPGVARVMSPTTPSWDYETSDADEDLIPF